MAAHHVANVRVRVQFSLGAPEFDMPGLIDKLWRATPHGGAPRPLPEGIKRKAVRRIGALISSTVNNASYRANKEKDASLEKKYIGEVIAGLKAPIRDLILEFRDDFDMRVPSNKKFLEALDTKIFEDTVLK